MRCRPDDDLPVFRWHYGDGTEFISYRNNRITPYDVPNFFFFLSTGREREEQNQDGKRKGEFRKMMNFHRAPTPLQLVPTTGLIIAAPFDRAPNSLDA